MHRMASGYGEGGCSGTGAGGAELQPELSLASDGSDSSHEHPASSGSPRDNRKRPRPTMHEDVEMMGGSGSGTESHGNESHGNESVGSSSNGNSKDSALLESSVSNKSSNSHSPSSTPSSSNAFSLVSSEQDNPSSSGCSSEQSAKAKTRKELSRTIKELKKHLPTEKRNKGKPSTLNTLKYALRCVKQVKANEEHYQMLMTNDSHPPGLDVSSYTIEEIHRITSEYTLKSTDIFAVAVSLVTGKIIYISDQSASILNCKRQVFDDAKFVEFLAPQDVSVFYSFTTPYRLPSWSMCTGAESSSSPNECMQEKSFFCRISGGKEHEGDLQYYPFRMTPYLMKVQDPQLSQEQLCCLLLAERVHSGYEAPRIPPDKRIFTTTHTPNCVFQDVDERAVPLLGYLPQDLIGTPLLRNLHPSDRPFMLAVHRKIVQYAGQPFDHSSIRFRAKNGEYVTIDTSWSSFLNPWSRKVSFVIGRHKVRTGPVNEAVFAAPAFHGGKLMDSDIQEISEQIHRLLLQPVHNMGSSGYGSNGSHEQLAVAGSSSESAGNATPEETEGKAKPARSFQEICKGVHMLKNQQDPPQGYLASASPLIPKLDLRKSSGTAVQKSPVVCLKHSEPPLLAKDSTTASMTDLTCNDQTVYSYQQINCLDSVIRYLESYNVPIMVKRKYQCSDTDMQESQDPLTLDSQHGLSDMKAPKTAPSGVSASVVGGPLPPPLPLLSKAESVVSITSQCSYRSTIVCVGDKKPLPESEIIEDVPQSPPVVVSSSSPSQEKEAYKRLDLTKQVLAAHTQKEEQAFLHRCGDLRSARTFQRDCSTYLHKHRELSTFQESPDVQGSSKPGACGSEPAAKKGSRNRKSKKPRMRQPDSSDSAASDRKPRPPLQGLNQTSWSLSEASQSAFRVSYPAMVPAAYQLPVYPTPPAPPALAPCPEPSLSTAHGEGQNSQAPPIATAYTAPMVTPVVALVLPNYLFPPVGQLGQMGQMGPAPSPAFFPEQTQTQTAYTTTQQPFHTPQPAYTIQTQASFNSQQVPFPAQPAYTTPQPFQDPQVAYTALQPFQDPQVAYTALQPFQAPQVAYTTPQPFQAPQVAYTTPQPFQAPQVAYTTPQPFQAPQVAYTTPQPFQDPQAAYTTQQPFQDPQAAYTTQQPFTALPSLPVQAPFVSQASYPDQPCSYGLTLESSKSLATESREGAASRSSTPVSEGHEVPSSPSLFESRCSTPLQLNLLSMEETQRSAERRNSTGPSAGAQDSCAAGAAGQQAGAVVVKTGTFQMMSPVHGAHSDSNSSLTDLEVLLQEDTGSLGSTSGSNGFGTSASGAPGSRTGSSSNTSKYFDSEDSLEHDGTRGQSHSQSQASAQGEGEHFAKCALQEPLWLLMANADDNVMMTYEMPSRDIQRVLREDKEKLRQMQKSQPRFSSDQRRELMAEHPWVRRGGMPSAINVKECVYCEDAASEPVQEDLPDMDLGDMGGESGQEGRCPQGQTQESPRQTDYGS